LKFQSVESFEKHLKEAAPLHPSTIYLIVSGQAEERKKWIAMLAEALQKKIFYAGAVKEALFHLNSFSLFEKGALVVLDPVDDIAALLDYVVKPAPSSYLILGADNLKKYDALYDAGKKEMVVFDFSAEKPWQREKRLKKQIALQAIKAGKTVPPAVIEALFEGAPLDWGILEQEMEKLLSYVGDRKELRVEDVQAVSRGGKAQNSWKIAEALVRQGILPNPLEEIDLFGLIGQMRFLLEKGLLGEMEPLFAKKGLRALFDLELSAKNGSSDPHLLLALFAGRR
jgi:DNA polymerase-3 subunit delta